MNVASPVRQWATELSKLAAGTTIAAFILWPAGAPALSRVQRRPDEQRPELVTSVPDGLLLLDLRLARFQTHTGLETADLPADMPDEEDEDPVLLAARLREVSGLPVATLAQLAGVSRMTYHNWLNGEGISEANTFRLAELLGVLRALRDIRGDDIREFLEAWEPLGRPIDLLLRGENDTVLGLALSSASAEVPGPVITDDVWGASGLQGWIQPVASLNWGAPRLTDEELGQAVTDVNLRPWLGQDVAMDANDEAPFVAHVQFVG